MQSPNIIVITALVAAVAARPQLSQLEPFFAGLSDHTSIAANPGRVTGRLQSAPLWAGHRTRSAMGRTDNRRDRRQNGTRTGGSGSASSGEVPAPSPVDTPSPTTGATKGPPPPTAAPQTAPAAAALGIAGHPLPPHEMAGFRCEVRLLRTPFETISRAFHSSIPTPHTRSLMRPASRPCLSDVDVPPIGCCARHRFTRTQALVDAGITTVLGVAPVAPEMLLPYTPNHPHPVAHCRTVCDDHTTTLSDGRGKSEGSDRHRQSREKENSRPSCMGFVYHRHHDGTQTCGILAAVAGTTAAVVVQTAGSVVCLREHHIHVDSTAAQFAAAALFDGSADANRAPVTGNGTSTTSSTPAGMATATTMPWHPAKDRDAVVLHAEHMYVIAALIAVSWVLAGACVAYSRRRVWRRTTPRDTDGAFAETIGDNVNNGNVYIYEDIGMIGTDVIELVPSPAPRRGASPADDWLAWSEHGVAGSGSAAVNPIHAPADHEINCTGHLSFAAIYE